MYPIKRIADYLKTNYPEDILMPARLVWNEKKRKQEKRPWTSHKDGQWTWEDFDDFVKKNPKHKNYGILSKTICTIDIDCHDVVEIYEEQFKELTTVARALTNSGKHYYFNRDQRFDDEEIYDGARQLNDDIPLDIKTRCRGGTGGFVVIPPSEGKNWIESIYDKGLTNMSNELFNHLVENRKEGKREKVKTDKIYRGDSYTVEEVKKYIDMLDSRRANDRTDWINLMMALHNCGDGDEDFMNLWIEFSKQSPKYTCYEDLENNWWSYIPSSNGRLLTFGSIKYWAKSDNPKKYEEERCRSVANELKECIKDNADINMATLFKKLYPNDFMTDEGGDFYFFNGVKWVKDTPKRFIKNKLYNGLRNVFIQSSIDFKKKIMNTEDEEQKKLYDSLSKEYDKIGSSLGRKRSHEGIIDAVTDMYRVEDIRNLLDSNTYLLGFENGVYDLSCGIFRKTEPEDFISRTVGYKYNKYVRKVIMKKVKKLLRSIFEEDEMYDYMLKKLAYCLSGDKYNQEVDFWTGTGANGKGVLSSIIKKVFGGYYCAPDPSFYLESGRRSGGASPERIHLIGTRVAISSEPPANIKLKCDTLKTLSGKDTIQARDLYSSTVEFVPQFQIIMLMNDKPELTSVDGGIERRLRIINFPLKFVDNPVRDNERLMNTNIDEEISDPEFIMGFMNLLLETYSEFIKGRKRIEPPKRVMDEVKSYMEESDIVLSFLNDEDFVERTNNMDDKVTSDELYNTFRDKMGEGLMTRTMFLKQVAKQGYKRSKLTIDGKRKWGFYKLKLVEEKEEDGDAVY